MLKIMRQICSSLVISEWRVVRIWCRW